MIESINTAPKDGTKILCDCSDGKKRYCWWFGCSDVDGFWMTEEAAEPVVWYPAKGLSPSLKEQALQVLANADGADHRIEWLGESPVIWHGDPEEHPGSYLREARLPKFKSQAEEALDLIDRIEYNAMTKNSGNEKAWDLEELESVRRALKRLQELEKHDD